MRYERAIIFAISPAIIHIHEITVCMSVYIINHRMGEKRYQNASQTDFLEKTELHNARVIAMQTILNNEDIFPTSLTKIFIFFDKIAHIQHTVWGTHNMFLWQKCATQRGCATDLWIPR